MRTSTSLRWRSPKQLQHLGRLVEVQVHQDRGDDLRVLVAHQLGHRARLHPLQAFDAADVAALQDAVEQQVGLVLAERLACSTARTYSSLSATSMLWSPATCAELVQHLVERARG